jgi:hypothetical protein
MRDPRRTVGDEGEGRAEAYLRGQGFRILGRNVRSPLGELDLIADDQGVLVFVEVKRRRTRQTDSTGRAISFPTSYPKSRLPVRRRGHSGRNWDGRDAAAYYECIRPRWG